MRLLPTPQGQTRPRRLPAVSAMLRLDPLPTEITRSTLAQWRARHGDGARERYEAACAVARAAVAAQDVAEASGTAWAEEGARLAMMVPARRAPLSAPP